MSAAEVEDLLAIYLKHPFRQSQRRISVISHREPPKRAVMVMFFVFATLALPKQESVSVVSCVINTLLPNRKIFYIQAMEVENCLACFAHHAKRFLPFERRVFHTHLWIKYRSDEIREHNVKSMRVWWWCTCSEVQCEDTPRQQMTKQQYFVIAVAACIHVENFCLCRKRGWFWKMGFNIKSHYKDLESSALPNNEFIGNRLSLILWSIKKKMKNTCNTKNYSTNHSWFFFFFQNRMNERIKLRWWQNNFRPIKEANFYTVYSRK